MPSALHVWVTDFGWINLPADFPFHVIRKNGWWDLRFKKDLVRGQAFIAAETLKLQKGSDI